MEKEISFLNSLEKEIELVKNGDTSSIIKGVKLINERLIENKKLSKVLKGKYYLMLAKVVQLSNEPKKSEVVNELCESFISKCINSYLTYYNADSSHPAIGDIYTEIGSFYAYIGDYNNAIDKFNNALEIRLSAYGLLSAATADCHYNLGLMNRIIGNNKRSLKELNVALEIRKKLFKESSLEVCEVLYALAVTEYQMGNYRNANAGFYSSYRLLCNIISNQF